MKQLNGSAEPLTESQVKEHQEKYGRNELVEGKKKTVLQIFLGTVQGLSCHHPDHCGYCIGIYGRCGKYGGYFNRYHNECNTGNSSDCESRAISCQPEKTFRSGSKSAEKRNSYPDSVFGSNSR